MARKTKRNSPSARAGQPTTLRIVGGQLRGSKLRYAGDPRVRPMKERIREAIFNLLGPQVKGMFAVDLFGGTGALALEAVSRGAVAATIVERHIPTSKVIRENIAALRLEGSVELVLADAFRWSDPANSQATKLSEDLRWVVFISPPYRLYVERTEDVLELINNMIGRAPEGSVLLVEATNQFDFESLPWADQWDVRSYPPAVVGILAVTTSLRSSSPESSIDQRDA